MKHAFQHVLTKLTSINNNLDVKIMGILLNFKFACFKNHQNLGRRVCLVFVFEITIVGGSIHTSVNWEMI